MRFFSRFRYYLLLLGIHALLAGAAFQYCFVHGSNALLCNTGDGMRNYFALTGYVKEPLTKDGLFKYNAMGYPYGDYVWTTDNTPLFSVPFRFFCAHVHDVSAYVVAIYNGFIIGNILLCGLLLFWLLRRICRNDLLAFLLAVILPWVNVQVMRIWRGHFNLSLSCFVVGAICLLWLWHQYRERAAAAGAGWYWYELAVLCGLPGAWVLPGY